MDLVDIGLFGCEGEVGLDLVANLLEEGGLEKVVEDSMLVSA